MVSRGRWQAERGPVDVAIKTLRDGSTDIDGVRFLQEAAINGQFRHPNIVQLHGVVTMGEPVDIYYMYMYIYRKKYYVMAPFSNSFPIPTGNDCAGVHA